MDLEKKEKIVVIGAGPVGALAALYAAKRGYEVEIYELRGGLSTIRLVDDCDAAESSGKLS
jgi:2-polyprenyl-6-methoxyphenol hydroxylase-like FAD-dependent oxidoreductase